MSHPRNWVVHLRISKGSHLNIMQTVDASQTASGYCSKLKNMIQTSRHRSRWKVRKPPVPLAFLWHRVASFQMFFLIPCSFPSIGLCYIWSPFAECPVHISLWWTLNWVTGWSWIDKKPFICDSWSWSVSRRFRPWIVAIRQFSADSEVRFSAPPSHFIGWFCENMDFAISSFDKSHLKGQALFLWHGHEKRDRISGLGHREIWDNGHENSANLGQFPKYWLIPSGAIQFHHIPLFFDGDCSC
jgi:hypothetical protein